MQFKPLFLCISLCSITIYSADTSAISTTETPEPSHSVIWHEEATVAHVTLTAAPAQAETHPAIPKEYEQWKKEANNLLDAMKIKTSLHPCTDYSLKRKWTPHGWHYHMPLD